MPLSSSITSSAGGQVAVDEGVDRHLDHLLGLVGHPQEGLLEIVELLVEVGPGVGHPNLPVM
jgi:hypothetical protein